METTQQTPADLVRDDLPADDEELGTPAPAGDTPETPAADAVQLEQLTEALKDVVDPELGINVVDLGLVYGIHVDDDAGVTIDMTLTSAACPLTDVIEDQTEAALEGLVTRSTINWVWMPPWSPAKITDDGREQLRAIGFNV
ncbi:metal-sulfur cluster assembly factor [Granulicoccus phenolivorans]|uniref:metal-sulfur cluster assembly factor n=1 Tax=Granulicoccus phenolivorans TaxID=266854 RepID=UPI00041BF320